MSNPELRKRLDCRNETDDMNRSLKRVKCMEGMEDRLSNLPDSVIRHILSLTDAKSAVQTSVLARKWRLQWASVPGYTLDLSSFETSEDVENFALCLMNHRKPLNISKPSFVFKGRIMDSLARVFCSYACLYRSEEIDVRNELAICDHKAVDRLSTLPAPLIHHILSLMETKFAVRTCVLSKRWKEHWTHVHSLNFDRTSFHDWADFMNFVDNVMQHRKSVALRKLYFHSGISTRMKVTRYVFNYAVAHGVREIETDMLGRFPKSLSDVKIRVYLCPTLKTIKSFCDSARNIDMGNFVALKSLRLASTIIPSQSDVFRNCVDLEDLVLENCIVCGDLFRIAVPNMISLTVISKNSSSYDVEIIAPKLKFFTFNGKSRRLSFNVRPVLEEVNIETTPSAANYLYADTWRQMVEGLCNAKSISVLVNLPKGRFLTTYSSAYGEVKVKKLDEDPGKTVLLSTYYVLNGLKSSKFATTLAELRLVDKKRLREEKRRNRYRDEDRLSQLPDPIIHSILSLVDTQTAVQTSILSKKWRNHWKSIHTINLHDNYETINEYRKFLFYLQYHRRPSDKLNKLNLNLYQYRTATLAQSVARYAVRWDLHEISTNIITFPESFYRCCNLTTLELNPGPFVINIFPDLSRFPSLKTLKLVSYTLPSSEIFSKCLALEHLSLIDCWVHTSSLTISAPKLDTLILKNIKGLRPGFMGYRVTIKSPRLKSLTYSGTLPLLFTVVECPLLENVSVQMIPYHQRNNSNSEYIKGYCSNVVSMTEVFYHVKSFTLCFKYDKEDFVLCPGNEGGHIKLWEINRETREKNLFGLATM